MLCAAEGCDRAREHVGLCDMHYARDNRRRRRERGQVNPRKCSIEDCGKPHFARGYCAKHYERWKKHGDPGYEKNYAGPSANAWRGGRFVNSDGYISVYVPDDSPFVTMRHGGTRYTTEHRFVLAQYLGRPLYPFETVHHINGEKTDNRLENLQLRVGQHGPGIGLVCHDCGSHRVGPGPLRSA